MCAKDTPLQKAGPTPLHVPSKNGKKGEILFF